MLERRDADRVFDLELLKRAVRPVRHHEVASVPPEEAGADSVDLQFLVRETAEHVVGRRITQRPAVVRLPPGLVGIPVTLGADRPGDVVRRPGDGGALLRLPRRGQAGQHDEPER